MPKGIILARGGSKSIPMKNIRNVAGRPLIYWTLKAAVDCQHLEKVYVSTDSEEIESVVNSFGFSKVEIYKRSAVNASDEASSEDAIIELLDGLGLDDGEIIQFIQATSPLIQSQDLEDGFSQYQLEKIDSLLSVSEFNRFIWQRNGKPMNYDPFNRPRRQEFEGLMVENGAFYIFSAGGLRKNKSRLFGKIGLADIGYENSIELDELDDLVMIEALLRARKPNFLFEIKLFATDVDGTLTDGKVALDNNGVIHKSFSLRDGMGFGLLKDKGILSAFVTGENDKLIDRRAEKLGINFVIKGVHGSEKLEALKRICSDNGVSLENVAYVGDDINDLEALTAVGFAACPSDAHPEILSLDGVFQLSKKGGDGCVREIIDLIISGR